MLFDLVAQLVLRQLGPTRPGPTTAVAFGAAVLFAAHPVHCEAVAGIVGRADLLAAFFGLLAVLVYSWGCAAEARPSPGPGYARTLVAAGLAGVAMLCKETGICVVPVLTVLDVILLCDTLPAELVGLALKRSSSGWAGQLLRRQLLLWGSTVLMVVFRFSLNRDDVVDNDWSTNPANKQTPAAMRALTKAYYNVLHARLLVWPTTLSADWACLSVPVISELSDPRILEVVGLLAIVVATSEYLLQPSASGTQGRAVKKLVAVSFAMTVFPFLPSCGAFLNVGFVVAERLLYSPSMGVCMMLSTILAGLVSCAFPSLEMSSDGSTVTEATTASQRRHRKKVDTRGGAGVTGRNVSTDVSASPGVQWLLLFAAVVAAICAAGAAKTRARSAEWVDEQTLYRTAAEVLPGNCRMHHNYATTLDDM